MSIFIVFVNESICISIRYFAPFISVLIMPADGQANRSAPKTAGYGARNRPFADGAAAKKTTPLRC